MERWRKLLDERDVLLERQEQAWPSREQDQQLEAPPPPRFRELQAEQRQLETALQDARRRLDAAASVDPQPLLDALAATDSQNVAASLAPLAARHAMADPRIVERLEAAARRWRPCPVPLARALEAVESEEADAALLGLGRESHDPALLRAAARGGSAVILAALIRDASGADADLARGALDALRSLELPGSWRGRRAEKQAAVDPGTGSDVAVRALLEGAAASSPWAELQHMLMREIEAARAGELRVALLSYLGLFGDPSLHGYFSSLCQTTISERERVAALSALGRMGGRACDALLAELQRPASTAGARRASIHALGAARCRKACRELIECLDDVELAVEAQRALSAISGREAGGRKAHWLRWWRTQPECAAADRDPEQDATGDGQGS